MKKSLQLLCLTIALALIPASLLVAGDLPADSGEFVQKKYSGWNGVLRGWISCRWEPGGSFMTWLNGCAAEFEKEHEGVYLEFTRVEEPAMAQMHTSGIRPPELAFFSPGVMKREGLLALEEPAGMLPGLAGCGEGAAVPVAMGGYIWVYNRQLCSGAPEEPGQVQVLLPDGGGRNFSAALPALMSGTGTDAELELENPGIDLGLPVAMHPVAAPGEMTDAPFRREDALDAFIDGELPCLVVTQAELARLVRLRDGGRGPDWDCAASGAYALADQLLFAAAVAQPDGSEREALAKEFIAFLYTPECQEKLKESGAFPVTAVQPYPAHSAYAQMAALLQGRRLLTVRAFSEYSNRNSEIIVRDFTGGRTGAEESLMRMGYLTEG